LQLNKKKRNEKKEKKGEGWERRPLHIDPLESSNKKIKTS
jgi:hypothetical protein